MTYRIITETEARAAIQAGGDVAFLPFQFVNTVGLAEIQSFLATNHIKGGNFTPDMLREWAAEAEFQLAEGNGPSIEIKSWDSVSGRPEVFTVSARGIEWAIND